MPTSPHSLSPQQQQCASGGGVVGVGVGGGGAMGSTPPHQARGPRQDRNNTKRSTPVVSDGGDASDSSSKGRASTWLVVAVLFVVGSGLALTSSGRGSSLRDGAAGRRRGGTWIGGSEMLVGHSTVLPPAPLSAGKAAGEDGHNLNRGPTTPSNIGSRGGSAPAGSLAGDATTVTSTDYTPSGIQYIFKGMPFEADYFVHNRSENICEVSAGAAADGTSSLLVARARASLSPPAVQLAEESLLPDCPPTNPNDSSAAIKAFAHRCDARGGEGGGGGGGDAPSSVSVGGGGPFISEWSLIPKKVHDRINAKALKLLMAGRGCDETLSPASPSLRAELWFALRNEHYNDLSILDVGTGCGHTLEWLVEYWMGPNATEGLPPSRLRRKGSLDPSVVRPSPRFNIMGIDASEASIRYLAGARGVESTVGHYPATSRHMLVDGRQQPSSMRYCQADPMGDAVRAAAAAAATNAKPTASEPADDNSSSSRKVLRWVPSGTFNLVFVMDQLNAIISQHYPQEEGGGGDAHAPSSSSSPSAAAAAAVCLLVEELLRVTKVGGAVWAGHVDDPRVLSAVEGCQLGTCSGEGATNTSSYTVRMTMVKESYFYGSPRFLAPKHLLERKPVGVLWRKVPI